MCMLKTYIYHSRWLNWILRATHLLRSHKTCMSETKYVIHILYYLYIYRSIRVTSCGNGRRHVDEYFESVIFFSCKLYLYFIRPTCVPLLILHLIIWRTRVSAARMRSGRRTACGQRAATRVGRDGTGDC